MGRTPPHCHGRARRSVELCGVMVFLPRSTWLCVLSALIALLVFVQVRSLRCQTRPGLPVALCPVALFRR
jgi:hypothetical protein